MEFGDDNRNPVTNRGVDVFTWLESNQEILLRCIMGNVGATNVGA